MEESVKSIGILYICTGPYNAFMNAFFESFESFFLPGIEKHYYVFTDCEQMTKKMNCPRIHCYSIEDQPWPLITLLRFRIFLKAEKELKKHTLLLFSNANIVCCNNIKEKEILPDIKKGEKLFFTAHPGYYNAKPWNIPLERSRKSFAYVPYNCGKQYVIGAFFGGYTEDFLEMTHILDDRICEDLKKGIIARWHDESHINHYIATHNNYKVLDSGYCYPVGFDVPFTKRIMGVSKADVFDVNHFKGFYPTPRYSFGKRVFNKIFKNNVNRMKPILNYMRDVLLRRKPTE